MPRSLTRRDSLGLIGSALLLGSCAPKAAGRVRIGSKSSGENATIAEIYAIALERENIAVERRLNLGSAETVMAAIQRGEIDLYPEYVRTGGKDVPPVNDTVALHDAIKPLYTRRYGVTWLTPSPANDSPCLVTSPYAAEQYWLLALTRCAAIAPKLRFAATSDFLASGGAFERLQQLYGTLKFKEILTCDPGEQYDALSRGDVDVANGFTTDPQIAEKQLIVLRDDKGFWPRYNIAPVIRLATIQSHARVRSILDHISQTLTEYAVQQITMRLDLLSMDPHDVAEDFMAARTSSRRVKSPV
jgi:osmoprotectant transport system substrate-binding protein